MKTKICPKCKEYKDITEFHKSKIRKDGYEYCCKQCKKEYASEYYKKNNYKIKKQTKKYRQENKEKYGEYYKKYYRENKEKYKEQRKVCLQKKPHRYWSSAILNSHKRSGYQININIDELEKLAKAIKYCPICDIELDWRFGHGLKKESPSLDRINNEKIINKDNVWIICHRCNYIKSNRTLKEFIEYCKMVVNKYANNL